MSLASQGPFERSTARSNRISSGILHHFSHPVHIARAHGAIRSYCIGVGALSSLIAGHDSVLIDIISTSRKGVMRRHRSISCVAS